MKQALGALTFALMVAGGIGGYLLYGIAGAMGFAVLGALTGTIMER